MPQPTDRVARPAVQLVAPAKKHHIAYTAHPARWAVRQPMPDTPDKLCDDSLRDDPRDVPGLAAHDAAIDAIIRASGGDPIAMARRLQERFGFVPRNALSAVAQRTGMRLARLYGVITFYGALHLRPRGRHVLRVCHGTACHVVGAERVSEGLLEHLGISEGETTEDRGFTVEKVGCIGCCSLAPVMTDGERTWGRLDRARAVAAVVELAEGEP